MSCLRKQESRFIPAQAGTQAIGSNMEFSSVLDSRFRGNDASGLAREGEAIFFIPLKCTIPAFGAMPLYILEPLGPHGRLLSVLSLSEGWHPSVGQPAASRPLPPGGAGCVVKVCKGVGGGNGGRGHVDECASAGKTGRLEKMENVPSKQAGRRTGAKKAPGANSPRRFRNCQIWVLANPPRLPIQLLKPYKTRGVR